MTTEDRERSCLNCGQSSPMSYCPRCGQPTETPDTVSELLGDLWGELFNFDAKLWTTLKTLVLKPGRLSLDYILGKRASQLSPLKLYFFISAIYVILYVAFSPELAQPEANPQNLGVAELFDGLLPREILAQRSREFESFVYSNLALIYVALLPLMTLPLFWIMRKWKRTYLETLIFAAHFETMVFLLLFAEPFLERLDLQWILYLASFVYLVFAMRTFYALKTTSALLKALLYSVGLSLVLAISVCLLGTTFILLAVWALA